MIRLTRAQVRKVDELAIRKYGIPGIVLMENAARAVFDVAMQMLHGIERPRVAIVCGGGNNGGDGFAVARHLYNAHVDVRIHLATEPARLAGDALINCTIAKNMQLPMTTDFRQAIDGAHLLIDALFGTGLSTPPRPESQNLIRAMNQSGVPILAVDLPSGLDCDTGVPLGECVVAKRTMTFVAEKAGFGQPEASRYTGVVTVGDIGAPRELWQ